MLVAVDKLRDATDDLAKSSRRMDDKTHTLVVLAGLTLAIAIVSLAVALVAVIR